MVVMAVFVMGIYLALGLTRLGVAAVVRARADTAADAAALAAADMLALGRGSGTAVAAARETASANGAELVSCRCSGHDALVRVRMDIPGAAAGAHVTVEARAQVRADCLPNLPGTCG